MIINKAKEVIEEFQVANFTPSKPIVKEADLWINPKPPQYKVNTDEAVFAQQQDSGVGAVIRDNEGRVVAALSKNLHYPLGPLEAEAKALEEAIDFAWDVGI